MKTRDSQSHKPCLTKSPPSGNIAGLDESDGNNFNMIKRATRANWPMPRFSRPVSRHTNKLICHGQQEETI